VFLTSFAALSFLPTGSVYGQAPVNYAYAMTAGALVLVVNISYIVAVVLQLVQLVDWRAVVYFAREMLHQIFGKFSGLQHKGPDTSPSGEDTA
jgi:uncharacterized protein YbbC (DUF1343 family)